MKRFIIGFGWLMVACFSVAGTGTINLGARTCRLQTRKYGINVGSNIKPKCGS